MTHLHFKWTVSHGRDTDGYNICTLYADGQKVGGCNGGGYDMQGTALAQWLCSAYQDRLLKLFEKELKDPYGWKYGEYKNTDRFYGVYFYCDPVERVSIDGACGFSAVEKLANAVGVFLKWNPESDKRKNDTWYTAFESTEREKAA